MSHTPGPWTVRQDGAWDIVETGYAKIPLSAPASPLTLAKVSRWSPEDAARIPAEGNAALMAAAPDLLAALERAEGVGTALMESFKDRHPPAWLTQARTAIAKAKGA